MTVFLAGCVLLVLGYAVYGRVAERAVRPDPDRVTPAIALADGLDFVAMPTWRVYLIQLLNIAGLGPVFGPIMGALWGPQVFLWVVFGAILGGAIHDFLSGVMSIRNNGAGLPDLIGHYLGSGARHVATAFILGLMILVGAVFVGRDLEGEYRPVDLHSRVVHRDRLARILLLRRVAPGQVRADRLPALPAVR
ncbi:MAG: carbon starvation CstA family protein, partial [Acidobacteriota bacterium]